MDNFGDGFIVDTGSAETLETTDKQLPIFNSSGYSIGIGNEEEENVVAKISQKSVPAIKDELFSLESMTIKEALDRCPYKPTFFCSDEENVLTKTKDKMEGAMLEGLQCYLEELKIKKYNFITDGIEAKKDITQLGMSANQLRKLNRKEREKFKGDKWFNMKAPEMTEELKNDLTVLQMRSALDPKHFYKRSEMKTLPKYFEMGKVIDSPMEYHNNKNVRKRNKTLVDELMEDAEFQKFNKRKYQETLEQKKEAGYIKAMKKMRKLKKRKG